VKPALNFEHFEELSAKSQQLLEQFLDGEIKLGFTFAELAATERNMGNLEHFQHAKRDAVKAAESVRHFSDRVENKETRKAVLQRCAELEEAIAAL
jgi:hypothetical protein